MADDTACSWPAIIFNAPSFQLMVRRTWLRAGATVGSGCSSANGSGLWLSIKRKRDHFAMTATFQSSQISYTGNIQKPFKKCLFSNHQILELVGSSSKPAPCWTDAKTDPQEGTPPPSQEHLLSPSCSVLQTLATRGNGALHLCPVQMKAPESGRTLDFDALVQK